MKNKPKPISRPKKQIKSVLKKTPAVKAASSGKKKKTAEKTGKNKIGTLDNADLHKMERKLRETKERLRLLSEAAEEGIAVHDNGVILDANDALARLFGYELSEMIGMKSERFTTPESWKVIQKHISQKYDKTYEAVGIRKDGSSFICSLVGKPYKYKGRTLRLSTFRDITERKWAEDKLHQAEDKLHQEEQRFKALAEQSSDIIVFVNRDGIVTYENPAVEKLLGLKPAERIGVNVFDRVHPDDLKFARDMFNKFTVNKSSKDINSPARQIRLRHQDGSWRTFETTASKLLHDNIVEAVIINLRDITERKKAESQREAALEALRESEQRLALIYDTVEDVIFLLAVEPAGQFHFISVNSAFLKVTGLSPEMVVGRTVNEVIPEPSLTMVLGKYRQAIAENTIVRWEEISDYPTGRLTGVVSITPVFNGKGTCTHVVGSVHDITERKKAERELNKYRKHLEELVHERTIKLEASNKELEAFSYSASHDLRAPLRSIEGFSQALLEDCEDKLDIQGKDYLIRIRAATRRMADLIEDLLQLSRITRTEMNMEKVNLTRIATFVIDELQKSQPQRHVEIRIADGLEETADLRLMRIVLENLLGNAWKFTGKKAQAIIEFGLEKREGKNVYFIRDNGGGFDMAYVDKLFAPFQRLHTEEEFPGTGIGLATARRIIHRHGGNVWTEGATGKGATFYFSLNEK